MELLLPVGNLNMAMAAVHSGADAIYVGFPGYNARGRTATLEPADLQQIIEFCHLHGVRVHLALNILIFQNELEDLITRLHAVLQLKPDALIVQDLGLAKMIRQIAPDQAIHASTQMTVTNHEAIHLLEDLNIRRFVLGRENSLNEIKLIRQNTKRDLEVFVHGALCVAYSGQCFTSESIGGRSANRGQCAQSCRFSYELIVDGEKKDLVDRQYLVSPQDLCGLAEVPELLDIGVNSFKIEGRLKTPEYVAEAAREYRQAIDRHLQKRDLTESEVEQAKMRMATTYSRGFFSGWLQGVNHQKLVDGTFSAHRGYEVGRLLKVEGSRYIIQLDRDIELSPGDGVLFAVSGGKQKIETGAQIYEVRKRMNSSVELQFARTFSLGAEYRNAKVYLNRSNALVNELGKTLTDKSQFKKIPVQYLVKMKLGEPMMATLTDGKIVVSAQTSSLLALAQKTGLSDQFVRDELSALGGSVFVSTECDIERAGAESLFISHKEIKELRRSLSDKLTQIRSQNRVDLSEVAVVPIESAKAMLLIKNRPHLQPLLHDALGVIETQKIQPTVDDSKTPATDFDRETQVGSYRVDIDLNKSSCMTKLNLILRAKEQVDDLLAAIVDGRLSAKEFDCVILDFEFGRDYAASLAKIKSLEIKSGVATTRILKPQEYNNLKAIERMQPDVILLRNLGALRYFTEVSPFAGELRGDFSLNVTNHLTAEYLLSKGLSSLAVSYDLNFQQTQDLLEAADSSKMEITIHQYMPSFHMEHCVFAAFLSKGSSYRDCGKPCEKHKVELKDQFGNRHFIKADQECRNTMYNARAISASKYLAQWKAVGLGFVRFEALHERGAELIDKIQMYVKLLQDQEVPEALSKSLGLLEKYGVSAGPLSRDQEYVSRKN